MANLGAAASKQAGRANVDRSAKDIGSAARKNLQEKRLWVFSFRFYRQHKFFGFSGQKIDHLWLVSLIERLKDMSSMTIDDVISDPAVAQSFRYHKIDWAKKNVPIQRETLAWIDKIYLEDEENYPLTQFQVSRSLGRIVGFFDEMDVFNIVLLDPLHNIQPSKDYDYIVDPCDPMDCELTQLQTSIRMILESAPQCECDIVRRVREDIDKKSRHHLPPILVAPVDPQAIRDAKYLVDEHNVSFTEILTNGIYSTLEKHDGQH